MGEVIDMRSPQQQEAEFPKALQALRQGIPIGLPTEVGYVIAANLLVDSSAKTFLTANQEVALGITHVGQLADFTTELPARLMRILGRAWPGPLVLHAESREALLEELPEQSQSVLQKSSTIAMTSPGTPFTAAVVANADFPIGLTIHHAPASAAEVAVHVDRVFDAGPPPYTGANTVIEPTADAWRIVREGVYSQAALNRLASKIIVFVCTGNTCRSPMAEGLFRKMLAEMQGCPMEELDSHGYLVTSAGLAAFPGSPASASAVQLLKTEGVDISAHESQPLSPQLVDQADLIVTMTRNHRDAILSERPDAADRVRLLSAAGEDVADPFGGDLEEYRWCKQEIEQYLQHLIAEFQQDRAA